MILIVYAAMKLDDNLKFFFKNGYLNDPDIQYVFVFNDPDIDLSMSVLQELLSDRKNYKFVKRENVGYDFGAWAHGLFNSDIDYQKYDHFVFMNGTVRGPFIHSYVNKRWCDIFIEKLNDDVKLVGTTINCLNTVDGPSTDYDPHVQSMFFVTDKIGLDVVIKNNIFETKNYISDKRYIVIEKEIGLSKVILKNGYNISCMLEIYRNHDFRKSPPTIICGDHYMPKNYLGGDIYPFEVIFFKTNRFITPVLLQVLTERINENDDK
jgi:lipopolysaccharide biosynthesis protein